MNPLIQWTEKGLYCEAGDFYIDPKRAVETAIITHAHSDHARRGSRRYLCAESGLELLTTRLGERIRAEGFPYGRIFEMGTVSVSFHPAGHILGSSQIRIQQGSEVWVASGDYKRDRDPSCEPFETVRCDTFITEATFGTPKYIWNEKADHGREIYLWWKSNAVEGRNSIVFGYSLGKAQRLLSELAPHAERPILIHASIDSLTQCYRRQGRNLAPTLTLDTLAQERRLEGELILAPPSILKSEWLKQLGEFRTAFASGWMKDSWNANPDRKSFDHGFVISDHADWNSLNRTIDETGARRVFVQHRNGALIRHLRRRGIEAYPESYLQKNKYQKLGHQNLSLFE